MNKLTELLEICNKACPGPWEVRYRDIDNHEQAKVWAETYGWLITRGDLPRAYHDPSMEFIAALNPLTAITLITSLQKALEALENIADNWIDKQDTKVAWDMQAKACDGLKSVKEELAKL